MEADLHARACKDPDFLDRVTRGYHGVVPVLDALWWRSHPSELSPAGEASPQMRSRQLRLGAYARPTNDDETALLLAASTDFDARLLADERALDIAIAAAERSNETLAVTTQPADQIAPSDKGVRRVGRPLRYLVRIIALAAAFLLGGVLSEVLSVDRTPSALTPIPAPSTTEGSRAHALVIFDRETSVLDTDLAVAKTITGSAFLPDSFRQLSYSNSDDHYFAARDAKQHVCLVAIRAETTFISTCMTDAAFAQAPLTLSYPRTIGGFRGGEYVQYLAVTTVTWSASGDVVGVDVALQ